MTMPPGSPWRFSTSRAGADGYPSPLRECTSAARSNMAPSNPRSNACRRPANTCSSFSAKSQRCSQAIRLWSASATASAVCSVVAARSFTAVSRNSSTSKCCARASPKAASSAAAPSWAVWRRCAAFVCASAQAPNMFSMWSRRRCTAERFSPGAASSLRASSGSRAHLSARPQSAPSTQSRRRLIAERSSLSASACVMASRRSCCRSASSSAHLAHLRRSFAARPARSWASCLRSRSSVSKRLDISLRRSSNSCSARSEKCATNSAKLPRRWRVFSLSSLALVRRGVSIRPGGASPGAPRTGEPSQRLCNTGTVGELLCRGAAEGLVPATREGLTVGEAELDTVGASGMSAASLEPLRFPA
mmetsp:Transcript_113917/g.317211  ORF Transcript_113917/g.317211 Transcript_113917/m.317211 type:complete len:362 (-) Transcript_113917:8-1093(-)